MRSFRLPAQFILSAALLFPLALMAQERDRNKIPNQYKWDLTDLYESKGACGAAKQKFLDELAGLKEYQGTLGKSAARLTECLELLDQLNKQFARLYTFASMSLDQDMRDQTHLALQQEIDQLGADFSEKSAYIEPEILAINPTVVQSFLAGDGRLEKYRHYLIDIRRRNAHLGADGEERIIAEAELLAVAPSSIQDMLVNADLPYPEMTNGDGKKITLDPTGFDLQRRSSNRECRKEAYAAYLGKLNEYRRTLGALLNAQIMKDLFYMKARKYNSCLESSLDRDNIPVQVYSSLVESVKRNLAVFHRYLRLRQRVLGVDQLHYYDLATPLVDKAVRQYTFDEAKKNVLGALEPLGTDYIAVVKKAFSDRWIDVFPSEGKRSGGYSNSWAYDVHPYIMINFNGSYGDMEGLAHEIGHAVQGYLSNVHQPFVTAVCPRFVVEVAPMVNEALLIQYMLKQSRDDDVRLALLGDYLDGFALKIFRATLLSEFELRIHEMAEQGAQLTGDTLNSVYLEMTRRYYGHDNNVCFVDENIKSQWTQVPQLYHDFYAYQYATAYTASAAISELVWDGEGEATRKYLDFLSSGGSEYPIELMQAADVDMTSSEPFELSMQKMNRAMDELERILDGKN